MIQEKQNQIEVVGYLSEVDLKDGSKDGKDYIAGTIKIKTEEAIGGKNVPIEIPFNVFSYNVTSKGNPNPAYESLQTVRDNMISVAACGSTEGATRVRVYTNKGGIRENAFINKQGQLINSARLNGSFFNYANSNQENCAKFETVIFILAIKDEVNRDGELTDRIIIDGGFVNYNGELQVVPFVVANKDAITHIKTYWKDGDTVKVFGKIAYTYEVETITEEVGFGEPVTKQKTVSHKEFLITSGSPAALDPEESFNNDDIVSALAERKRKQDQLKAEFEMKSQKGRNTTPTASEYGF